MKAYLSKGYAPTLFVYTPIEFPMVQDGHRPPEETREELDKWIREIIKRHGINHLVVSGSVVERLKQVERHIYV
jgi:metallophosphoesterase superfamily enzyme